MKEATTNPTPHMLGPRERTLVPADEVRQNSFSNQNWTVLDSLGHALFDESDRHEFHLASIELVLVGRSGEEQTRVLDPSKNSRIFRYDSMCIYMHVNIRVSLNVCARVCKC